MKERVKMKIKYNWEFERYVTDDGKVFRYDSKQDKLVLCKPCKSRNGYCRIRYKGKTFQAHRVIFETFVGKIPQGYELDHINTVRDDNRLENLRLVTHKENVNNPLSIKHLSESKKGLTLSNFGSKFKKHYGITYSDNSKLYDREKRWYYTHNHKCRWEMNTDERN